MFHFLIAAKYQFPSMSCKLDGMCRSREVDSPDNSLSNSCENSSIDKVYTQKYLAISSK